MKKPIIAIISIPTIYAIVYVYLFWGWQPKIEAFLPTLAIHLIAITAILFGIKYAVGRKKNLKTRDKLS